MTAALLILYPHLFIYLLLLLSLLICLTLHTTMTRPGGSNWRSKKNLDLKYCSCGYIKYSKASIVLSVSYCIWYFLSLRPEKLITFTPYLSCFTYYHEPTRSIQLMIKEKSGPEVLLLWIHQIFKGSHCLERIILYFIFSVFETRKTLFLLRVYVSCKKWNLNWYCRRYHMYTDYHQHEYCPRLVRAKLLNSKSINYFLIFFRHIKWQFAYCDKTKTGA